MSSILKAAGIIIAVLLLDGIVKWAVQADLPHISRSSAFYPYGGIGIFDHFLGMKFAIVHETNRGAAWGAFADFQPYLMALRIALVAGLLGYILFFNRPGVFQIPLALIAAGAIGNVIDYFIYGHVIDMFQVVFGDYYFPVFNVADSAIFIGVVWIVLASMVRQKTSLSSHSHK